MGQGDVYLSWWAMANYLVTNFKGKYRILPEIDANNNDFVRDCRGNIDEDMVYIACSYGNKIYYYGLNESRRAVLGAYIPSTGRGHNIKKALEKDNVSIFDYDESDEEVVFHFLASDIDKVAYLMKAKTGGANISPFSTRNLPSSDVKLPDELEEQYKAITSKIGNAGMLVIKDANNSFLIDVVEKNIRKKTKDKTFSVREDMKLNKMSRQFKVYVWKRGYWNEYLDFLNKEIEAHCA